MECSVLKHVMSKRHWQGGVTHFGDGRGGGHRHGGGDVTDVYAGERVTDICVWGGVTDVSAGVGVTDLWERGS